MTDSPDLPARSRFDYLRLHAGPQARAHCARGSWRPRRWPDIEVAGQRAQFSPPADGKPIE